jgi:hypothetical protein
LIQETSNLILHKFDELQRSIKTHLAKQKELDENSEKVDSLKQKMAQFNLDKEFEIGELTRTFEEDMFLKFNHMESKYLLQVDELTRK